MVGRKTGGLSWSRNNKPATFVEGGRRSTGVRLHDSESTTNLGISREAQDAREARNGGQSDRTGHLKTGSVIGKPLCL